MGFSEAQEILSTVLLDYPLTISFDWSATIDSCLGGGLFVDLLGITLRASLGDKRECV